MAQQDCYIYKMPYKERQEIVNILNDGDSWRDLGGNHLKYSSVELSKFGMAVYKPCGSPADAMLTHWGQRNHTVLQLFKHLRDMGHFQAMVALKPLIPEKYHKDIRPQGNSRDMNTTVKAVFSRPIPHPPPPVQYAQANRMMEDNIDVNVDKGYKFVKANVSEALPKASSPVDISVRPRKTSETSQNDGGRSHRASSVGSYSTATNSRMRNPSGLPDPRSEIFLTNYTFEELKNSCSEFHHKAIVGKGGFGEVYEGYLNRQHIAVKRIRADKRNIDNPIYMTIVNQFFTELFAMHAFRAENILPLVAYSYTDDLSTDPCLVYQFMENGSVSDWLKRRPRKNGQLRPPLTWQNRIQIALGVASGLCFLHAQSPKIIHGDIKSGNILLDNFLKPFIGDFGLARGGPDDTNATHRTLTTILGTDCYLPDDFRYSHYLCEQVDTFCYGILLFELVTGKSPSFKVPSKNYTMRDVFLDEKLPLHEYWDSNIQSGKWTACLHAFARDCTRPSYRHRPDMVRVHEALSRLVNPDSLIPQSIALQSYHDSKKAALSSQTTDHNLTVIKESSGNVVPNIVLESNPDWSAHGATASLGPGTGSALPRAILEQPAVVPDDEFSYSDDFESSDVSEDIDTSNWGQSAHFELDKSMSNVSKLMNEMALADNK